MLGCGKAEGKEGEEDGETEQCNADDGAKAMCVRMQGHSRVYKYTRPKSGACTCLCVSWGSLNVTQNYLNKLKTEVSAASVAAT